MAEVYRAASGVILWFSADDYIGHILAVTAQAAWHSHTATMPGFVERLFLQNA
jgi:hypothetical protein